MSAYQLSLNVLINFCVPILHPLTHPPPRPLSHPALCLILHLGHLRGTPGRECSARGGPTSAGSTRDRGCLRAARRHRRRPRADPCRTLSLLGSPPACRRCPALPRPDVPPCHIACPAVHYPLRSQYPAAPPAIQIAAVHGLDDGAVAALAAALRARSADAAGIAHLYDLFEVTHPSDSALWTLPGLCPAPCTCVPSTPF